MKTAALNRNCSLRAAIIISLFSMINFQAILISKQNMYKKTDGVLCTVCFLLQMYIESEVNCLQCSVFLMNRLLY